jgi:hypothetical protein
LKIGATADKVVFCRAFGKEDYESTNPTGQMVDFIRELHDVFKFKLICMDRGGGGSQIRDLLTEEVSRLDPGTGRIRTLKPIVEKESYLKGDHILEVVNFTTDWINETAFDLLSDLDNRRIWFPVRPRSSSAKDDPEEAIYDQIYELTRELTNIVAEPISGGKFRFKAASGKKDRATALWLAVYASHQFRGDDIGVVRPPAGFGITTRTVLNAVGDVPSKLTTPLLTTRGVKNVSDSKIIPGPAGSYASNSGAASLAGRVRRSDVEKRKKK